MKRWLGGLVVIGVIALGGSGLAWAGVAGGETGADSPTNTTVVDTTTQKHYSDAQHRVVRGFAARRLAPNFLDNDWDRGSLADLTAAERAYLKSVSDLDNQVWYAIDLTGQTLRTGSDFSPTDYVQTGQRTDRVTTVTRVDGGYLTVHQDTNHLFFERDIYQVVAEVYDASPLVLDLNGDGRLDVARNEWRPHSPRFFTENARFFDITGDGTQDFTEWMSLGPGDGLLVRPENGRVDNALQLFGTAGGYTDGFEKLALVQDRDGNGWVEGPELEGLFLWVDVDSDGQMQPTEMRTLDEFAIQRIATRHRNYVGQYVTRDGAEHTLWDWWPATKETRRFRAD